MVYAVIRAGKLDAIDLTTKKVARVLQTDSSRA